MNDRLMASDARSARERLVSLGRWYASRPRGTSPEQIEELIAADAELRQAARTARIGLLAEVDRRAGPFDPALLSTLLEVPREWFVRPEDVGDSADDTPLLLNDEGLATISAPHAYLLSFRVIGLTRGDRLAELGTGSGYGAALASPIVTAEGGVLTIEIDEILSRRATRLLRDYPNVRVVQGEAGALIGAWRHYERVIVTFAVESLPPTWLDALPIGGRMVVPVGRAESQRLMRVERCSDGSLQWSDHGAVRYVPNRARDAEASLTGDER